MANSREFLTEQISPTLTIQRSIVSKPFDVADLYQFEKDCRDYIQLDRTIKTFEAKREAAKQRILDTPGIDRDHFIGVSLKYPRKRISHIKCWLNRFHYDIEKLWERLKDKHRTAFNNHVKEGTAFRVVIPTTQRTRKPDVLKFQDTIGTIYPGAEITPYASVPLEPMIDELGLLQYCSEQKVSLKGIREPVYNFSVKTE